MRRIQKGDEVKVVKGTEEDFPQYVMDFLGKEGALFDISVSTAEAHGFHVLFKNGDVGVFYENELETVIKGGKK